MCNMIYVAPLQGFTEAPFRHFHAEIYGGADAYYSPFLRIEHGEVRMRDLRDIYSPMNGNHRLIPQIIFRNVDEFRRLVAAVTECGYKEIDMNFGCPFQPQVKRGRGAGAILDKTLIEEVAQEISLMPDIVFSVKMRLGVYSVSDSLAIADLLNSMRLSHVTVHPRIAVQQYKGDLLLDGFDQLVSVLDHPIVFNGDIVTADDIDRVATRYSYLSGIMIGRGVLARPSLLAEWRERREWSDDERRMKLKEFHSRLFGYYSSVLCGDSQILSKIKPFWEYLDGEIGNKVAKRIRKSTSCGAYLSAVADYTGC